MATVHNLQERWFQMWEQSETNQGYQLQASPHESPEAPQEEQQTWLTWRETHEFSQWEHLAHKKK